MQKRFVFRVHLLLMVLTCASLACQAGGLVPSLFATVTPTPTVTPSPTVTPIATATVTPPPTSIPGDVSLEVQADGSTFFTDTKAGFSLLITSTWVCIPANVDDLTPYVEQASENNPQFSQAFSMLQNVDPNILRIMAMDTNMDHYKDNYVPNFSVIALKDPLGAKMPLKNTVQMMGDSIKSQFPGIGLLNSGIEQVSSDFSYGYNEWKTPMTTQDGAVVKVFQKQVFFSIQDYFVVMTLSAHSDRYDEVLLDFNTIMETIQMN